MGKMKIQVVVIDTKAMFSFAADLTQTADLAAGLWIVFIVSIAAIVLCPLLCWTLPNRTRHV